MMKSTLRRIADKLKEDYESKPYDFWVALGPGAGFEATVDGKHVGVELVKNWEDEQQMEVELYVYGPGPISCRWHVSHLMVIKKP